MDVLVAMVFLRRQLNPYTFIRCHFSALCAEPKSLQFFARNRSPVWGRALDCTTHALTHTHMHTLIAKSKAGSMCDGHSVLSDTSSKVPARLALRNPRAIPYEPKLAMTNINPSRTSSLTIHTIPSTFLCEIGCHCSLFWLAFSDGALF